jgi:hypothetical protein
VRTATPLAGLTLAVTLALAGAGCGSEAEAPAAPAYVGQWSAVIPDLGGSYRDVYNVNPDGTYWYFSWWEPLEGGSLPDFADRGTYALTAGSEVAGTLTFRGSQKYDFTAGTWSAYTYVWPFTYTLDTTVTPRALRRDDGGVYGYVGPPTANPPLP